MKRFIAVALWWLALACSASAQTYPTPTFLGNGVPLNLALSQAIASNQLTVSILANDSSGAPSSTHRVVIGFNDGTTQGSLIQAVLTSQPSMTLANTSSLGCSTGTTCRIWVTAICQTVSGTTCSSVLLGLSVQSGSASCLPLLDDNAVTTGTGTTGGNTLGTIYTSVSAVSSKFIRIIGYVEASWTSGTGWTGFGARTSRLFGPGVPRPCTIVQEGFLTTATQTVGSGTTKTATALTVSPTLTSALNLVDIDVSGNVNTNTGGQAYAQIGRGSSSNLIGNPSTGAAASAASLAVNPMALDQPGSSSPTYTVYIWDSIAGGNPVLNPTVTGATLSSSMRWREIMGALDVPVNDNEPLRSVG